MGMEPMCLETMNLEKDKGFYMGFLNARYLETPGGFPSEAYSKPRQASSFWI